VAERPRDPERLTVARIVKTQGRRGEVAAQVLTTSRKIAGAHRVWLWDGSGEPRRIGVQQIWPHKSFLVFHFKAMNPSPRRRS
jgi:ribosomal 30S subunit maturation factor RimM